MGEAQEFVIEAKEELDHLGPSRAQALRGAIGDIALCPRGFGHQLARLGGDARILGQRARDGGDRKPGGPGDGAQRGAGPLGRCGGDLVQRADLSPGVATIQSVSASRAGTGRNCPVPGGISTEIAP